MSPSNLFCSKDTTVAMNAMDFLDSTDCIGNPCTGHPSHDPVESMGSMESIECLHGVSPWSSSMELSMESMESVESVEGMDSMKSIESMDSMASMEPISILRQSYQSMPLFPSIGKHTEI